MNFSLPLTSGAAQGEAEAGCLVLICLEVGAGSWDNRDILCILQYCVLFELNLSVIHHPGQFYNLMFYDTRHIKIYTGNENLKQVLGSLLRSIRDLY